MEYSYETILNFTKTISHNVLMKTIDFRYIIHKYEEILNNYDRLFNLVKEKFNEDHLVKLYEYTLDFIGSPLDAQNKMEKIFKQGIIEKDENKFLDINKLLVLILENNTNVKTIINITK